MRVKTSRFCLLAPIALSFAACSNPSETFELKLTQLRCEAGISEDGYSCSGKQIEAGVFEIRLMASHGKAVFKVVKQDEANLSEPLYDEDCVIWDGNNWRCFSSGPGFTETYAVQDGRYSRQFNGTEATYYIGRLEAQGTRGLTRDW